MGVLAYLIGGWQQVNEQEPFHVRLTVDGEMHEFEASCVTVANAAPPTSVFAQGKGPPDMADGLLDVTVVTDFASQAQAVETMGKLFLGTYQEQNCRDQTVRHWQGRNICVETEPAQKYILDGEMAGETPLTLESVPGALKVFLDHDLDEGGD